MLTLKNPIAKLHRDEKNIQVPKATKSKTKKKVTKKVTGKTMSIFK